MVQLFSPDGKESLNPNGSMVGIYMPMQAKNGPTYCLPGSPFGRTELNIVRHIICALLLLHGLGITHNDIRRAKSPSTQQAAFDPSGTPVPTTNPR